MLADARHVKNLPGRPKRDTDRLIARERNRLMDGPDLVTASPFSSSSPLRRDPRTGHWSDHRPLATVHRWRRLPEMPPPSQRDFLGTTAHIALIFTVDMALEPSRTAAQNGGYACGPACKLDHAA